MRSKPIDRVWVDPPKYWAATKNMTPEQVERLLDDINSLVQAGDEEALRRFDFVSLDVKRTPRSAA